jgi:hypothetical protein
MRSIYTSPRVENIDRVVALLHEAGIETSVTNRRAWAGHDYKRASYASPPERESWPQVWIVKAEDQPRARALLRDAGIAPATRFAEDLEQARSGPAVAAKKRTAIAWRIRLFLLATIVILILLNALHVLNIF